MYTLRSFSTLLNIITMQATACCSLISVPTFATYRYIGMARSRLHRRMMCTMSCLQVCLLFRNQDVCRKVEFGYQCYSNSLISKSGVGVSFIHCICERNCLRNAVTVRFESSLSMRKRGASAMGSEKCAYECGLKMYHNRVPG